MTKGLHIIGTRGEGSFRYRYLITYRKKAAYLTGRCFEYLVALTHARIAEDSGWIHKENIEPGFNQWRYLYRLRSELSAQGLSLNIENNSRGYYRLADKPADIQIEWGSLLAYPDSRIVRLARKAAGRAAV